jgi:hypothetical protein
MHSWQWLHDDPVFAFIYILDHSRLDIAARKVYLLLHSTNGLTSFNDIANKPRAMDLMIRMPSRAECQYLLLRDRNTVPNETPLRTDGDYRSSADIERIRYIDRFYSQCLCGATSTTSLWPGRAR